MELHSPGIYTGAAGMLGLHDIVCIWLHVGPGGLPEGQAAGPQPCAQQGWLRWLIRLIRSSSPFSTRVHMI